MAGRPVRLRARLSPRNHLALRADHVPALDHSPSLPPDEKSPAASGEAIFPGESSFLWLWALSPLLFFTLARNILPAYVLPGIPAWCILTVRGLWQWDNRHPGIKNLIFLPASMFAIMAVFLLGNGFGQLEYRCQKQLLQAWTEALPYTIGTTCAPPIPLNSTHPEKCSAWNREYRLRKTEQPIWQ